MIKLDCKPTTNFVFLEYIKVEKTEGGILIPEQAQKREDHLFMEVLAVGCEVKEVKVGDWVLCHPDMRCPQVHYKGKEVLMVKDYDIVAIRIPEEVIA